MNEVRTSGVPPSIPNVSRVQVNNDDAAMATTLVFFQLVLLLAIPSKMRYATMRIGINVPSWAAAKVENGSI